MLRWIITIVRCNHWGNIEYIYKIIEDTYKGTYKDTPTLNGTS